MTTPFQMDDLLTLTRLSLDAHCVGLFLPLADGQIGLMAASCEGHPDPSEAAVAGRGLVGWIVRNKKPLIVDRFDAEHSQLGYYDEEQETAINSFMGFPLPHGGALCVDTLTPRNFTPREQRVLAQLAVQCDGCARHTDGQEEDVCRYFESIALIQELRQKNLSWQAYLGAFLDLVVQGANMDYAAFASLPENATAYTLEGESTPVLLAEDRLLELPLTAGIAGWVFRNDGLPVFAEGLDGTQTAPLFGKFPNMPVFNAAACLPVVLNRSTCAVLCVASEEPRPLEDSVRMFLRMANAELTGHLEAITLRHRVQQLLPRATLHRDGALSYDPDTAPAARLNEDD